MGGRRRGVCLGVLEVCLAGAWRVLEVCLKCAWRVLEVCLAGAWSVLEGCLGGAWSVLEVSPGRIEPTAPGPVLHPLLTHSLFSHT